jgi:hypothetical protein
MTHEQVMRRVEAIGRKVSALRRDLLKLQDDMNAAQDERDEDWGDDNSHINTALGHLMGCGENLAYALPESSATGKRLFRECL